MERPVWQRQQAGSLWCSQCTKVLTWDGLCAWCSFVRTFPHARAHLACGAFLFTQMFVSARGHPALSFCEGLTLGDMQSSSRPAVLGAWLVMRGGRIALVGPCSRGWPPETPWQEPRHPNTVTLPQTTALGWKQMQKSSAVKQPAPSDLGS